MTATAERQEVEETPTQALSIRKSEEVATWTPRFAITVDEAVEQVHQKQVFMNKIMKEDVHFGKIPGAGERKVLLKGGAELLLSSMGLHPALEDAETPIKDYTGQDHGGEPFIEFRRSCTITRDTPYGPAFVARAEGTCNSWEKKFRTREGALVCPECGKAAIIKGKAEYGGGWLCFKKKDGCGAKFSADDAQITGQTVGAIPNPDVMDLVNTILKMADKRALVAATLIATGFSTDFTQDDVEDFHDPARERVVEASYREVAPTPAEEVSESDLDNLYTLAGNLPTTPKTSKEIDKLLKSFPYDKLLERIVREHVKQCGSDECEHLHPSRAYVDPDQIPMEIG